MIDAHVIAGARPNFMKVAPLLHEMAKADWVKPTLIHTGQHFSANMSDAFFSDLRLPPPDYHLGARGETHARQTAAIMVAYEDLLLAKRPDWVIVVGDVNSTVAATVAAKKLDLPVAHLEAGLRNFDRTLPEEINRIVTDSISDLMWTPSPDADANLLREGIAPERIDRVGNIMIDSLVMLGDKIAAAGLPRHLQLSGRSYAVVTLHRPSNVDDPASLARIADLLGEVARSIDVVFPVHPRTHANLTKSGLLARLAASGARLIDPLGYIDFMSLVSDATLVLTNSGGIQEETSFLGIPCLTLRPNTERPITVSEGTNRLVTLDTVLAALSTILSAPPSPRPRIDLWDGHTAERVVASLERRCRA